MPSYVTSVDAGGGLAANELQLPLRALRVRRVFVIFGQLVILNMLIAVVSAANQRVTKSSQQIARFGRAKLIVDKESDRRARAMPPELARRIFPRHIHVLLPPKRGKERALEGGDGNTSARELNEVEEWRKKLGRVRRDQ